MKSYKENQDKKDVFFEERKKELQFNKVKQELEKNVTKAEIAPEENEIISPKLEEDAPIDLPVEITPSAEEASLSN
jgi:hypothetical protein